jgi:hypothetical protein
VLVVKPGKENAQFLVNVKTKCLTKRKCARTRAVFQTGVNGVCVTRTVVEDDQIDNEFVLKTTLIYAAAKVSKTNFVTLIIANLGANINLLASVKILEGAGQVFSIILDSVSVVLLELQAAKEAIKNRVLVC